MKLDDRSNTHILECVKSVGLKTVLGYDFVQNSQIIGILKYIKQTGQGVCGKTYRGKNNTKKLLTSLMVKDQSISLRIIKDLLLTWNPIIQFKSLLK